MDEETGLRQDLALKASLHESVQDTLGGVGGRGQRLGLHDAAALIVDCQEVCEGAADVGRDTYHTAPRRRCVSASSTAPDAESKTTP